MQRTKKAERLISSGRSARRTRYRCRYEYSRTYGGEEIEDDPTVCLECREPAWKCEGEYRCYLRHKEMRDKPKKKEVSEMLREKQKEKTVSEMLLEKWKPSGIYDIWGENTP